MTHSHTHLKQDPITGHFYDARVRENLKTASGDSKTKETLAAVRCASHDFRIHMDRWLERHDLNEGRMSVMWAVQREGAVTLGELAEILDVSPRNITGLIDHLEIGQLVERFPDPSDRRSIRVRLTGKGGEKLKAIKNETHDSMKILVRDFTEEELELLRHLCLKLVNNMHEVKV